jgi:signal transduction histidine kinase
MLLAVVRDVSPWKEAQTALEQANSSLEKRVRERTSELADANAHLKLAEIELRRALDAERELSHLKSNFVSMVSHEFRTPLGIISTSAQILDRYFERLDPEDRTEHVRAINSATMRMAAMMENVLVLSRMDSRRMHYRPAPLPLQDFCRALLDELHSATGAARRIEFDWAEDVPEIAQADEHLLRHIFSNLLSNAVKYSPPDRAARFSVRRDDFCGLFTVSDEGIGIPEEDQARIFHAFHRGTNVGPVAGTGLGLVIAKRCCDLHSGEIAFESIVGRGTTFTVRLPIFQTTVTSLSQSTAS